MSPNRLLDIGNPNIGKEVGMFLKLKSCSSIYMNMISIYCIYVRLGPLSRNNWTPN